MIVSVFREGANERAGAQLALDDELCAGCERGSTDQRGTARVVFDIVQTTDVERRMGPWALRDDLDDVTDS